MREKNAFGKGNLDDFGGEKINGDKKTARRPGIIAAETEYVCNLAYSHTLRVHPNNWTFV